MSCMIYILHMEVGCVMHDLLHMYMEVGCVMHMTETVRVHFLI